MNHILMGLLLSGILTFADYATEHLLPKKYVKDISLTSFSAGVAVSYIFLHMMPELVSTAAESGNVIFIFVLIGFMTIHVTEKYIFLRGVEIGTKKRKIHEQHKRLHLVYFFFYNIIIGIVLMIISQQELFDVLLFYIPFLLYIVVEMVPQEYSIRHGFSKIIFSSAPLLGSLLAILFFDHLELFFGPLLAMITGTLLYVVIRESIPHRDLGKPGAFVTGAFLYLIIIVLTWII